MKRKHTVAALLAPLALLAGPASATTWDFYATGCIAGFPANACTGLPSNPYLFGTFTTGAGPGSSTLVTDPHTIQTGDTDFSLDFGPLFRIANGVQEPMGPLDRALDWLISWAADGQPEKIIIDTENSNLRFLGVRAETASDSPDMVGCAALSDCVFTGFLVPATVPEPGTAGLMLTALIGWLGFRWRRALTTARSALTS